MRYGIGHSAAGRYTTDPDVFVRINKDALDRRPQSPLGVVAIIATGAGFCEPGKPFSLPINSARASEYLTTSNLLTCANLAIKPFNDLQRGAGEVLVVPVNLSTKSQMLLNTTGGSPTLLATLKSKGWGLLFNTIQVKSETLKLTISVPTINGGLLPPEVYTYTNIADLCDQITRRSGIVDVTFAAEGTMATFANTAMTGGTEPAATNQDWSDAIYSLDGRRVNAVHVATSSQVIWAMLADYAITRRLRGFVGGEIKSWNGVSARQTSLTALKAEFAALGSIRMMHCCLGMNGEPGYIAAARYAGLAGALEPSVPMTRKHLDVQSLEAKLTREEVGGIDGLQLYGGAPPIPDPDAPNTFMVSRGLSTYIGSDNLYDREHSVLAAVDGIWDQIETGMRRFLGNEGTTATIARAVALTDQILAAAKRPEAVVRINDYRPESIVASISGQVLSITAAFTPIPPINFVDVTLNLEATEITHTFQVPLT